MTVVVIGSINQDLQFHAERFPAPGETLLCNGFQQGLGGKGANQAVAAARMAGSAIMLGAVGGDAAGDALRQRLEHFGVDTRHVARMAGQSTGMASICLADDDNLILVAPGANGAYDGGVPAELNARRDLTVLAQLEVPLTAIERALDSVDSGVTRILNAAPAIAGGDRLFPLFDILVLNAHELDVYASAGTASIAERAGGLLRGRLRAVIVTLGAEGCLCVTPEDSFAVAATPADAIDTVGAGDCFCGVLANALDEGTALPDAIATAGVAASLAVTRSGASEAMPSRFEVEQKLFILG